jgi:hypothetical protein
MRFKDAFDDIPTKASRADRRSQDICVEKNLHETSRKTSSSVKKPWASAKGMLLARSSLKRSILSWRRMASRAISLRFFPDRRQDKARSRSVSSSKRMVNVAVFMSYIVIRPEPDVKAAKNVQLKNDVLRSTLFSWRREA